MRALESPQPQDDVQWLTYWVVFGAFTFAETFVNVILYWFPFYYTIKTLIVLYLMLPQTQGAKVVYARVLRPVFISASKSASNSGATSARPATNSSGFSSSIPTPAGTHVPAGATADL